MTTLTDAPDLDDAPMDGDQARIPGTPAPSPTDALPDDPAAPYGRRKDGQPKGRPGRPRKPRANAAPKIPAPRRAPAPKKPSGPDYASAVAGPLQLIGVLAATTGQQTNNPALLADAAAIAMHTPAVSKAIGDLADGDPRIAAVLDRLAQVGPYGALVAALTPLVLQLAVNHGTVPAAAVSALGVVEPAALVDSMTAPASE